MAKVVRTLRDHWKKSTFAAIVGYFGIDYAIDRHKTFLMMRDYSQQALIHGRRRLPLGAKNKHITLLLNPVAGNRKAKGKLEKYAEPLLHLAGFLVSTVKTERIDEAKDLVGLIEKTNVIAVAGGDGTIFETVTGLLRREDADEAVTRYPIGVIPVGTENRFGKRFLSSIKNEKESKFVAEAAMAIINHRMKSVDVMEITISDNESATQNESPADVQEVRKRKPFYSLVGLNMGQFREAKKIKDEMPSFFGQFFSTFWSLFRVEPATLKAELHYIPTCAGCLKCKLEEQQRLEQSRKLAAEKRRSFNEKSQQPGIWSRLTSIFSSRPVLADEIGVTENIQELGVNPECGVLKSLCVETSELNVLVVGDGVLKVQVGHKMAKTDYMIEGLKRLKGETPTYNTVIDCKEIEICPVQSPDFFSIDSEEFEVKRVKLRAIKDRVNIFVP